MYVYLSPYTGPLSGNREIMVYSHNFPLMVQSAQQRLYDRLRLLPPDVEVECRLVDGWGSIPMFEKTGQSQKVGPNKHIIQISANAVANGYCGSTTPLKVLTHELCHVYFDAYGGMRYSRKPLWAKEGIALWVADQNWEQDFSHLPEQYRNQRWHEYLSYLERFEQELCVTPLPNIVVWMVR